MAVHEAKQPAHFRSRLCRLDWLSDLLPDDVGFEPEISFHQSFPLMALLKPNPKREFKHCIAPPELQRPVSSDLRAYALSYLLPLLRSWFELHPKNVPVF
jgi:hypothetical protein